jgi:hypothetical protein
MRFLQVQYVHLESKVVEVPLPAVAEGTLPSTTSLPAPVLARTLSQLVSAPLATLRTPSEPPVATAGFLTQGASTSRPPTNPSFNRPTQTDFLEPSGDPALTYLLTVDPVLPPPPNNIDVAHSDARTTEAPKSSELELSGFSRPSIGGAAARTYLIAPQILLGVSTEEIEDGAGAGLPDEAAEDVGGAVAGAHSSRRWCSIRAMLPVMRSCRGEEAAVSEGRDSQESLLPPAEGISNMCVPLCLGSVSRQGLEVRNLGKRGLHLPCRPGLECSPGNPLQCFCLSGAVKRRRLRCPRVAIPGVPFASCREHGQHVCP